MPPVLSKNMPITIHASLLVALVVLVWIVAGLAGKYETRLNNLEKKSSYRWTFQMEEDAWIEFLRHPEKAPNLEKIRSRYKFFLEP